MTLSHSQDVAIDSIVIDRENRQRRKIEIDDLIPSIRRRGILQPLLVERSTMKLIFGERRLTTAKFLGHETVPVRFTEDLSEEESQIIELEENFKRKDLTWQEQASAVLRIHTLHEHMDEQWTEDMTASVLGVTVQWLRRLIPVGEALASGDKSIMGLDTLSAAVTTLTRRKARATDSVLNSLTENFNIEEEDVAAQVDDDGDDLSFEPNLNPDGESLGDVLPTSKPKPRQTLIEPERSPFNIVHANTLEFLASYKGVGKFNMLHLDLPYGVELNGQANQGAFEGGGYESNPEIYWALMQSIVDNWGKYMYPSSHLMCWISMEFYSETIAFLEANIPGLWICRTPLVWHKSDNKGIISDPMRRARNIYEACLYGSVGDRKIVKPASNVYSAPTAKKDSIHTNEKPIPMLEHFMGMFVDHHSRVLDPTAGSGSAIRAAEKLGAETGLGLEFNPDFAERAQARLIRDRNLATLAKKVADSGNE